MRPNSEVFAQVRTPHDEVDFVLSVQNLSRSGALLELSDLAPGWLRAGNDVLLTLVAEGSREAVDLAAAVVRVDPTERVCAIAFDDPSNHARRAVTALIG